MAKNKYLNIYNKMEEDRWYFASELEVAPASMTAMYNRKMIDRTNTSPRKYKKIPNKLITILSILDDYTFEYFSLFSSNRELGMLCWTKDNLIYDCWGKLYDLTYVNKVVVNNKDFLI